jgi:hypothetical protein
MRIKLPKHKPRNMIAKDLLTPKYRMRVVKAKNSYNRQSEKLLARKGSEYGLIGV